MADEKTPKSKYRTTEPNDMGANWYYDSWRSEPPRPSEVYRRTEGAIDADIELPKDKPSLKALKKLSSK